ncbi:MAG TPA: NAD(P)-dependent oxidoreductase [Candidatus Methylacidiphilales bacterium]|jgi:dTDP-glucose 4,6-dehydratase|nr:NAD(P)-dependent oxidoreductase [Candidatus Methylacidiphilales bacterium]
MRKSQKRLFSIPTPDIDDILRASAADLAALRGKKLFFTGGTGFFGKWLLAALLPANAEMDLRLEITVLSRDPAAFAAKHPEMEGANGLTFLRGNVADFTTDEAAFDFILHGAADTTAFTSEAGERERSRAIVQGTQNVLDLARRGNARLLNISSGAVYGAAAGKPEGAGEDDYAAARPVTPYGLAKREAEALCGESHVDFATARAFAFLGPHLPLDAHFAAGNFLRDAVRGGPILVRGDGTALRSYLHPADLVTWLLAILVRAPRGRAYNVGSGETVSTAQLARLIAAAVEPKAEVRIQSAQPQGPQNIYLPDITRARTELGLTVAIPLREAIQRTLSFVRENT